MNFSNLNEKEEDLEANRHDEDDLIDEDKVYSK